MKYTIKVNEVKNERNIKAMVNVVFDDSFKVGSIAVVERKDGECAKGIKCQQTVY